MASKMTRQVTVPSGVGVGYLISFRFPGRQSERNMVSNVHPTGNVNNELGPEGAVGHKHCRLHPTSPQGRKKGLVQLRGGQWRSGSNRARNERV